MCCARGWLYTAIGNRTNLTFGLFINQLDRELNILRSMDYENHVLLSWIEIFSYLFSCPNCILDYRTKKCILLRVPILLIVDKKTFGKRFFWLKRDYRENLVNNILQRHKPLGVCVCLCVGEVTKKNKKERREFDR